MASHNTFTSFGMAKHLSDILYNAVSKCITRDIGMGNYEKTRETKGCIPHPYIFASHASPVLQRYR